MDAPITQAAHVHTAGNSPWEFACQNALASAMIEGFNPSESDLVLWNRFVNQEITGDEFIRLSVRAALEQECINMQKPICITGKRVEDLSPD